MFVETNPAPIKNVLARGGLIDSELRSPAARHPDAGWGCRASTRFSSRARRCSNPHSPSSPIHSGRPDDDGVGDRRQRQSSTTCCPRRFVTTSTASTSTAPTGAPRRHRSGQRTSSTARWPPAARPTSTAPLPQVVARSSTSAWVGLSARKRSQTLDAIADAIESRADVIAAFEAFDTGLPISQAHGLAARAAENFRYFADVCGAIHEDAFRTNAQVGYVDPPPEGRGRSDHSLERSVHARHVEARAVPRRRLHGRAQAGRAQRR